jgi:signal transduction histidine kinase
VSPARRTRSTGSRRLRRIVLVVAPILALLAVVAVAAGIIVLLMGELPEGSQRDAVVPVLVGLVVAAVAFGPLHRRARRALLSAVHGERLLPEEVIDRFGDRATRGLPLDELLRQLAESLRVTLALDAVEVWTSTGSELELAMAVPARPAEPRTLTPDQISGLVRTPSAGPAWLALWVPDVLDGPAATAPPTRAVPAVHSDALVGLVVVRRPSGAEPFDDADDRALVELGRRLGVVLHNRELDAALQATLEDLRSINGELQESRKRIVAASDSERRRIERDLHDGAQQHLVALAVRARLARDAIAEDPDQAAHQMDEIADELRDAMQEVRDLAHGIYPAVLVDSGVGAALRAAAGRSPVDVAVEADVDRFAPESEAAVYFCCIEALQNTAKHSPDATASIVVASEDGDGARDGAAERIRFTVRDDGPGFDVAATAAGHGLQNMADRAGALGGSIRWISAPGRGTTVEGWVPRGTRP